MELLAPLSPPPPDTHIKRGVASKLGAIFCLGILIAVRAFAQGQPVFSAQVTVNLDPSQFNLESLPGFTQHTNDWVFAGGSTNPMPIIIRQWTDGTVNVSTSSRIYQTNTSTGVTNSSSSTAGVNNSTTFTVGGSGGSVGSTSGTSTTTTTTTGTSSSSQYDVINSLTIRVEGNLVIAVIQYTNGATHFNNEITLGYITPEGGFVAFTTGTLDGKQIVQGGNGSSAPTNIDPNNAPADNNVIQYPPSAYQRGFVSPTSGQPILARVLVAYWVFVGTVNGKVVSVDVRGVYEDRIVGFKAVSNPYGESDPNGGDILQ